MGILIHEWYNLFLKTNNVSLDTNSMAERLYEQFNKAHQDHIEFYPWYTYDEGLCYTLPEFAKLDEQYDFIYDKSTSMVITNIKKALCPTTHEHLAAAFGSMIERDDYYIDYADVYSIKYGFFLSSVSYGKIFIGKDTVLTPEEKIVFKHYEFIKEL